MNTILHQFAFSPIHSAVGKKTGKILGLVFLFLLSFSLSQSYAQFAFSDQASNYGGVWANGNNQGTGYNAWAITTGGANAGTFIGNPAGNGMGTAGIGTTAFGLFGHGGQFVNAVRFFGAGGNNVPMQIGDVFSFHWAMNWDCGSSGAKGFDLRDGGTTVFNVNNSNSATISTTNGATASGYGTNAMLVTLTRTSWTQYTFTMTARDGNAANNYSTTINSTSNINNINIYCGSQQDNNGNRNIYFNNFNFTKAAPYETNFDVTDPRILAGSNNLTKTGTGNLTLTGVNTFNGNVLTNNNFVVITNDNQLGAVPGSPTASKIQLGGGALAINATITVNANRGISLNNTNSTIDVFGGSTATYNGIIAGSAGNNFNKNGPGTLVIGGANTYSGGTIVNNGILRLGAANVIPDASNVSLNGGTLSTGATTGFSETVGTLNLNANSTIALGTGNHTLTFANSNAVSWAGSLLTITGWAGPNNGVGVGTAGRIFIGNSDAGLTPAQLSRIVFNISSTLYSAVQLSTGEIVASGATPLYYGGATAAWNTANWSTNNAAPYSTAWTNGRHAIFNIASNNITNIGGANTTRVTVNEDVTTTAASGTFGAASTNTAFFVSAGKTMDINASQTFSTSLTYAITKNGPGTLALAGNTYGGGFTLNEGLVVARGVNAMGGNATPGPLNINGGTIGANLNRDFSGKYSVININADFTLGSSLAPAAAASNLTFNTNASLGSATRTITLGGTGTYVFNGVISGTSTAGLTIAATAPGTLSLGGANTYPGATTINGGTVLLTTLANRLPVTTDLIFANTAGATLDLNSLLQTVASLSGGGPLGGNISTGSIFGVLTVNQSSNTTYGGIISGFGGLTKTGSGRLTLTHPNHTFSGATVITLGELRLNPSNTTASYDAQMLMNGGTLSTTGIAANTVFTSSNTFNLNANSTLDLENNNHELRFANSNAVSWAGSTLVINGWTGTAGSSGTGGKIFFGTDATGLNLSQLSKISFTGYPGVPTLLSTGELVPSLAPITYEWVATSSTADWQVPASWSPNRNTTLSTDILTFPRGGTSTATNVPTEVISQFIMSNNTAVTLLPSAAGNSLSILGETGVDLDIPSGCSLTVGGANNLIINHITIGNTASIAGTLIISNANTSNAYDATNATTTVTGTFRNGGVVTSTAAQLVFNSGGLYEHIHTTTQGAIATATWNTGSTCAVIGYTTNTNPPAGFNQSFHHFTWNTPSQNTGSINALGNLTTVNGNFTVISTGNTADREFRLTTGSDYTLNIGGDLIVSGGTFVLSNGNGTPTLNISGNFNLNAGTVRAVSGNGNPLINISGSFSQAAGTLNLSSSTGNSTVNIAGNFSHTGGTITETGTGNNSILVFNGSASQSLNFSGTISFNVMYRFDNAAGYVLTGNVPVNNGSYVSMRRGAFSSTGTFTYTTSNTSLIYDGSTAISTTDYEFPATNGPVNLTLNNIGHVTLHAARELPNNGILSLNSGRFRLGNNNFSLLWSNVGAIAGTYDVNSMVVADGSGQLIRRISTGTNSYIWPIGDETGVAEYSPVTLNFTANGNASRLIGFNVVDANHPQLNNPDTQTHYLSRYWTATNSEASTYTYTAEFGYPNADVNNTEAEIRLNVYNGTAWQQTLSTAASNVLSTDGSETHLTFPIGSSVDFTGRVKQPSVYAWIPTTTGPHDFQTASNWNPSRTTLLTDDILTFPNGGASICNNVPTQSIGQLLMSNNTAVTFIPETAGNRILTLTGATGTDFSIPTGSAITIGDNSGTESLTIAFSGSGHIADISGTLTTSVNTSVDHRYNGTNATTTVSGTVNNGGIITGTSAILSFTATSVYNHIRNGGAIALASWNVSSTCNITGITTNPPLAVNQAFGIFNWNCTSQSATISLTSNLNNVAGVLSFLSTNNNILTLMTNSTVANYGSNVIVNLAGGGIIRGSGGTGVPEINIAGNLSILEGTFQTGTGNALTLSINGNLTINGGDLVKNNLIGPRVINLLGDLAISNGSLSGNGNFFFLKQGAPLALAPQNITIGTGGSISGGIAFTVGNNSPFSYTLLTLNTDLFIGASASMNVVSGSGINLGNRILTGNSFTLSNGGNLITANPDGIASSGATGSVQTTARSFNASCNFIYNGTAPQITGTGLPATSNFLTISNPTSVTLTNTHAISTPGALNLLAGRFLIGNNDFTLPAAAPINGGPFNVNTMIVTNGTGLLRKSFTGNATFTWPIGEITGTPEYSPATLNLTTAAATYGMRVVNAAHPQNASSPVYLNRYWNMSANISSYSWTGNFTYTNADLVGSPESNIRLNIWNPNAPSSGWLVYPSSSAASNVLSVTAGPGAGTLNNTDITGRVNIDSYYRTVSSGNWNLATNWEVSTDPTFVSPAPVVASFPPNDLNSAGITIRNTHAIVVNTLVSADDIIVETGGTININASGNLTVPNGTAATDVLNSGTININNAGAMNLASGVQVITNGYWRQQGTLGSIGTTLIFNNNATFEYANDGGSLPIGTWNAGSTCLVTGVTSVPIVGASLGQAFYHFTWSCNQTQAIGLGAAISVGNGGSIAGNFTVLNTGGFEFRLAATQNYTLNIGLDLIVSGGILVLVGTSTGDRFSTPDATVNVARDVLISGTGRLMVTNGWAAVNGTNNPHLNIARDLTILATSGVNLVIAGADPSVGGPPTTFSPSQITVGRHYSQTAASTVQMSRGNGAGVGTMRVAGNFTHSAGTITRLNAAPGEIIFNGTTVQTYTSGGTVSGNINYTLNTNAILDMNTSFTSGAGTFTMQNNSTIRLGSADGISSTVGIGNTRNTGTKTFPSQGTYVYNGVVNQVTGNLLPTNITGSLNINNTGGAGDNVVTLTINNTSVNTLNLQAGFFAAGTGQNLTINSGGTVNATGGDIAVGAQGGTLTFVGGAGGSFTGNANPYNVFTTSGVNFGTGNVTIQNGGTFRINGGGFVNTNAPFYASGSTLQYNTGGTYGRNLEWRAASGRGFPHHVLVSGNTTINPGANGNTGQVLNTGGNVTIDAGSNIYMDFGGNNMTVPLIIGANLNLSGNLSGSNAIGGDVRIRGNWVNNGSGANYFPNTRAVFFDGTSVQDIGGTNTTTNPFAFLFIDNSAGVTLSANQQVNSQLTFTNGTITLNNFNFRMNGASLLNGANSSRYFITNGSGFLYRTFANTNTLFPIGPNASSYNPIELNQTGTVDNIGVRVVETPAYSNAVNNNDEMVLVEYFLNEDTPGGNNLFTGIQWNASNEAVDFIRTNPVYHGNWTGTNWIVRTTNPTTGANPYVSNSIAFLTGTITNMPLVIGNINGILACVPSVANGNWNNPSTWGGFVPPTEASVCINHNVAVVGVDASISNVTLNTTGNLDINGGRILTLSPFAVIQNSTGGATNLGAGTVVFSGTAAISGPNPVTINNLTLNGNTSFTAATNINGNLTLNSGSFIVTGSPIYSATSTLIYNNTGSYNVNNEWTGNAITAGSGIPQNVIIQNGTTVNMPNSNRGLAGNLNITSGGLSLNATVGDLFIAGNWERNNTGTTFTPNNRAVFFNGLANQTISITGGGTESFAYLRNNKPSNNLILNSSPATNVNVTASVGNVLGLITTSALDLNGQTMNLSGTAGNIELVGGPVNIIGGLNSVLAINNGTKTVVTSTAGTLITGGDVTVALSNGINFGLGLSTIEGRLQIAAGGFVIGNAPTYAAGATLRYFTGTNYGRGLEWSALTGPGYPHHVVIDQNGTVTTLDLFNAASAVRRIAGNLTINDGAILNMNGMNNRLEVLGNVNIGGASSGTLSLGTAIGGDLAVAGNLTRNAGGTFTQNNRETEMNGTTPQDINGINSFFNLAINNTGSFVRINNNTTITNRLRLTNGLYDLNGFNNTMANGSEILRSSNLAAMNAEPIVSGSDVYDIRYTATLTTDNEFSSVNTAVRDLIIETGATPILNANRTFNRDMILNGGNFDLSTYTLTARGRVAAPAFSGSITVMGGGTRLITGSAGCRFDITGLGGNNPTNYTKTVSTFGGTLLSFDANVLVRIGDGSVDFGLGSPTTVNGVLQILLGGSVGQVLNPCYYGVNSILRFANTVDYLVGPFDKTWAAGAISSGLPGIPYNVEVFDIGTELRLEDDRALRGNMTITNGQLTLNYIGSGTFSLGGNWTRTGASSAFTHNDKTVVFNGLLAGNQIISVGGGVAAETFYNLELAPATGNITFDVNTNVNVLNNLNFVNNKLDLNTTANVLTIGTSTTNGSITGFDSNKYIISNNGQIVQHTNSNAIYSYPFGDVTNYTPFEISLNTGAQSGAFITGTMTAATHPNIITLSTFEYVQRYWDIVPTGLTTSPLPNYDVRYSYVAADEVGSNLTYRAVKYSYTNPSPGWMASPGGPANAIEGTFASHNPTTREFVWEGLSTFSSFTGAGDGSPLPISLLNFTAEPVNQTVLVKWTTASEINNDYFQIERSKDAVNYEVVGIVDGAGNSNQILHYQLVDENPWQGISYYRLRQVDFNGEFEIFDPVAVIFNQQSNGVVNIFPNPAKETTTITFDSKLNDKGILQLYNIGGSLIWQQTINAVDGKNSYNLDVLDLPAGHYIVSIRMNHFSVRNLPLIIAK